MKLVLQWMIMLWSILTKLPLITMLSFAPTLIWGSGSISVVHFPASQPECQPLMRYLNLLPRWLLLHLKDPPGIPSVPLINWTNKLIFMNMKTLLSLIIGRPIWLKILISIWILCAQWQQKSTFCMTSSLSNHTWLIILLLPPLNLIPWNALYGINWFIPRMTPIFGCPQSMLP